jgi:hypothetical protein
MSSESGRVLRRIPVALTIREAYVFAATHLGGVIGLIWVSMVMITVARFFTFYRFYNDFIDFMATGNAAPMGPALLMLMGYVVALLLLYAVMFVAVVQLALGTRAAPSVIHFAFGPLEWRMFRAFFAFAGLMFLISMALLMVLNAALVLLPALKMSQAGLSGVMAVAMLGTGLLLTARFLLLLPAIVVNETAPVLRRAWALSAGNVLPLLGVLLGLFLPLAAIFVAVELGLGQKGAGVTGATPQLQMISAVMQARETLPLTCGLGFFFSPLMIGLFAGASVSAWRSLKDEPVLDIAV